jgi:pimeloyl-ACP methyl ester carboxylesterase
MSILLWRRGPAARLALAAPFLAAALAMALPGCSELRMPTPTGPYPIGVTALGFRDPDRSETRSADPGAKREFLARVWYPAQETAGCAPMRLYSPELRKAMGKYLGMPTAMLEDSDTNAFTDAPINTGQAGWPVIVFAHGGGSFDKQNLLQFEEFASLGYVVISLSFPYESALSEFPDGRKIEQSATEDMKALRALSRDQKAVGRRLAAGYAAVRGAAGREERIRALAALRSEPVYALWAGYLETRFGDAVFLLEHLGDLNALPALDGRLDTSAVGIYGHSLGGALAMEIALRRPDLVKAVADMDCLVMDPARTGLTVLSVPSLFMYSTEQRIGSSTFSGEGVNDLYMEESTAPSWSVSYLGAGHYNFSDSGYVDFLKYMGLNGSADGYATGVLIQEGLSAFFGKFLKSRPGDLDFASPAVRVSEAQPQNG